jgi:hypothetical protein
MSSATLIPLPDGHDAATRSPGDDAGPRRVERARGLRSFLTWSFFLAQIAAAERFIGGEADAAQAEEGAAKQPAFDEVKAGDALPFQQGVAAASDGIPGTAGERAAPAAPSFAQNTAGEPSALAQQIAVAEAAPIGVPITMGGAGASGGSDAMGPVPAGIDSLLPGDSVVPGDLLPLHLDLNAPALLGNVTGAALDLVDGTLTSLGAARVIEDLFTAVFSHELPAGDLASITGLLLSGDAPSAQLMGYASLGDAEASVSAGAAAYPDLTLALADQQAVSIAAPPTPGGSLLHDLPVIGDALASTPCDADGDHHVDVSDLTSGLSQIADHTGLPKTSVDLWS